MTRYFYDSVNIGVQLEATHLRATQDGAPVRVSSSTRKNFRLVTIAFRDPQIGRKTLLASLAGLDLLG